MADIDVTNRKQLEAFLSTVAEREGGREQVIAFAARAALRAMPAFISLKLDERSELARTILLPCLRAMAAPWAAATYPAHGADLASAARAAADAAARAADAAAYAADAADAAARAADAAAYAADAAYAAADAAARAAYAAAYAADAAYAAADAADVEAIEAGKTLALQPLWPDGESNWARKNWQTLRQSLLDLEEDWEVWIDWYEARLQGKPTFRLSAAANERIEVARVLEIEEEDWKQGPAHVNAKIKAIIERETELDIVEREANAFGEPLDKADEPPAEPDPGPGPAYSATNGKLARTRAPPTEDDANASEKLLPRLISTTERLAAMAIKLENSHPELAFAIKEYAVEINRPFEELDLAGLFATGGALMEMHLAFESADGPTMTEELEPEVNGLLANVARQHGAFLLGTEEGKNLVERADRFLQQAQLLREIEAPGNTLLGILTDDADLVDEETRSAHRPLRDLLLHFDWTVGRTGYAAMVTVRKAVFFCLMSIVAAGAVGGGLQLFGTLAGDPQMQFLHVVIPFVRDYAAQILAFYQHSPEMRAYAEYAIALAKNADRDNKA
ncbi:MAG: hypothetical protein AAF739_16570 [Pseudomonadota bacterium]